VRHLLIVDDNQYNIFILRELIESLNQPFLIDEASNGQEGFLKIVGSTKAYDVVFMDLNMPVMDGIECVRQVRQA